MRYDSLLSAVEDGISRGPRFSKYFQGMSNRKQFPCGRSNSWNKLWRRLSGVTQPEAGLLGKRQTCQRSGELRGRVRDLRAGSVVESVKPGGSEWNQRIRSSIGRQAFITLYNTHVPFYLIYLCQASPPFLHSKKPLESSLPLPILLPVCTSLCLSVCHS